MTWHLLPSGYAACAAHLPPAAVAGIEHRYETVRGVPFTVVPHRFDAITALRRRGIPAPSMALSYDWPGRFPPRENQRWTVDLLLDHSRAAVLNEVRTGKTLAVLWAMDILFRLGRIRRALLIAPKTVCRDVWERELFLSFPHIKFTILSGTRAQKQAAARDSDCQLLIVNPESLHLVVDYVNVDLIAVDEATDFKEARTRRTRALMRLASTGRLWLLTGTPTPQSPMDAWALIRLLRRGQYMGYAAFRQKTMYQNAAGQWVARGDAATIVARELQPAVRFRASECYDVPEESVIDREVEPSEAQKTLAESLRRQAYADLEGQRITAVNAAGILSKILQVYAGGVYRAIAGGSGKEARETHKVDMKPTIDVADELLHEAEGPVILNTTFRASAMFVAQELTARGHTCATILGGETNPNAQAQVLAAFRRGEIKALVAIPTIIRYGLDLTVSNAIIWLSPPFSTLTYAQANARIAGSNQARKRVVYRLYQNSLVKALYKRLDSRVAAQDSLLALVESYARGHL